MCKKLCNFSFIYVTLEETYTINEKLKFGDKFEGNIFGHSQILTFWWSYQWLEYDVICLILLRVSSVLNTSNYITTNVEKYEDKAEL